MFVIVSTISEKQKSRSKRSKDCLFECDGQPIQFGDRVVCDAYLKKTHNCFIALDEELWAHTSKAGSVKLEEPGQGAVLDKYTIITPNEPFCGVCVGVTTISRQLFGRYYNDQFESFVPDCRSISPIDVAIVYYGNNRKRLVPLENIKKCKLK